ncbi:T9SS type A sorting domain-containing protein [Polaribacter sp. R77954]|uniref:T9SS type A sorting domain-containing protein n=1 Tax=Polaribacter sp. R77954 TaxID=3093870 RepID=UPI0037C5410B
MKSKILLFTLLSINCFFSVSQTTYIENFDTKGYPNDIPKNSYWKFFNDIHPNQTGWDSFIPGDGFAYITVDADISNDTDLTYPYQTMVFGGVGENHRLEVRMKGAAVDGGLAAFIFTYGQVGATFNEVDIEVVAQDLQSGIPAHDIYPPNGWTDARFNTWRDANEITELPFTGSSKPVVDINNNRKSLIDDKFHTYTIDWTANQVDFFIDNVLQESFNTNIAKGWSEVIIGYRNLPWAGDFRWSGTHTMVIDYFKIEELNEVSKLSVASQNTTIESQIEIFPNPTANQINFSIKTPLKVVKMELFNMLSSKFYHINDIDFQSKEIQKIDVSQLSKGVYFLKTEFENGSVTSKKIMKL